MKKQCTRVRRNGDAMKIFAGLKKKSHSLYNEWDDKIKS